MGNSITSIREISRINFLNVNNLLFNVPVLNDIPIPFNKVFINGFNI